MAENFVMPSIGTPFGERVERRLRDEKVAWLTTVGVDGTPQPNPVWFLWDGDTILIYSMTHAARVANIQRNARVAFNFDGDGRGGNIIIIKGEARISLEEPPVDKNESYLAKYGDSIANGPWGTPEVFAAKYTVPIRIAPTRIHGN